MTQGASIELSFSGHNKHGVEAKSVAPSGAMKTEWILLMRKAKIQ